ncbi:MAG: lamin tail domain-containing protein [Deltaproteobacteria bacterium]|nr:lamin tail domain-containing protein [Deltaproteobacteria bacterium]
MTQRFKLYSSHWAYIAAISLAVSACSGEDTPDGGVDAGPTADSGQPDSGADAGVRDTGDTPVGCNNPALTPPASGTCTFTAGTNGATLIRGDVITPTGILENAHVLVGADGKVACAACDCSADPAFSAAAVMECANGLISPALMNLHDHITFTETPPTPPPNPDERYDHRHDWRRGLDDHTRIPSVGNTGGDHGVSWGELRNLMAGATSINGSGGADGLLRNLDRSGGQQEGLGQAAIYYSTFPLDDSDGTKRTDTCNYGTLDSPTEARFQDAVAYTPHIAEGIELEARNEFLCLAGLEAGGVDLITNKTAVIHGIGLLPPDWGVMAADQTSLIWSARTNLSLYGVTADVITARESGVNIALGTDWTASGSMNMLRELRCVDEYNARNLGGYFSDREIVEMATLNAANAVHTADKLGSLTAGREADLTIFNQRQAKGYRAVLQAEPQDVVLVLRSGTPLYGDTDIMSVIPDGQQGCEALDVCQVNKTVCSQRETGSTIAEHEAAINATHYALFFCGEPPTEPSCIPFRTGEFMGVGSATDTDGDGVPNDLDNCPTVFNPIRPLDNGIQADFDDDMVGDACDACPLAEGTSGCAPPDPNDIDGDGTPNLDDNCPNISNPNQEDADLDDIGDACDACPNEANPNGAACSRTIYELKQRTITSGRAAVKDALVTAVAPTGYFLQYAPGDANYDNTLGADYSGIFVFTSAAGTKPAQGDRVDVEGTVGDYFGQVQLSEGTFTVTASGQTLPDPILVSPADVGAATPRGVQLEGVLVEVANVTVTELEPTPGAGDTAPTHEFVVDGVLRVNDFMYLLDPAPLVGEPIAFVRGVLRLANENYKIEPRSAADIGASAELFAFDPAVVYVPVGTNGVPPGGLQVVLTRPAPAALAVTLSSNDPGVTVPAMVTVDQGEIGADIAVNAPALLAGPATLSASYNGNTVTGQVIVYDDATPRAVTSVAVTPATLAVGGAGTGTVRLSVPGASAGTSVRISVEPAGLATATATVVVAAGAIEGTFQVTAGATPGAGYVVARLGTSTASAAIQVVDAGSTLMINEIDYDQPGTDAAEFVEIYNRGGTAYDLTGVAVVMVNGNGGAEYGRYPLSGTLAAGGYLVLGNTGVTVPSGVTFITLPANGLQNGAPDGIALVDTASGTVLDALSYEGAITTATIMGISGPVNLVEGTAATAVDPGAGSLARLPNGSDTDNADQDWALSANPTPGAANVP